MKPIVNTTETPQIDPNITFDTSEFSEYLLDCEFDETEAQELLNEIGKLVLMFVDLGFGIEATQAALMAKLFSDECHSQEEGENEI